MKAWLLRLNRQKRPWWDYPCQYGMVNLPYAADRGRELGTYAPSKNPWALTGKVYSSAEAIRCEGAILDAMIEAEARKFDAGPQVTMWNAHCWFCGRMTVHSGKGCLKCAARCRRALRGSECP